MEIVVTFLVLVAILFSEQAMRREVTKLREVVEEIKSILESKTDAK